VQTVVEVEWVGQVNYMTTLEWQKTLVAERTADPDLDDKLLLLEHPPTYTLGRGGDIQNLLIDEATLAKQGIALYRIGRGGDITYHGPGQLVGYPILNLKRLYTARGFALPDLHVYVREIESVIIRALADFGVTGWRYKGYTGVWVDTDSGPCKIAAIGVRVSSKGISSHGFAFNIDPELSYFDHIIPCGIKEHSVTSLSELLGQPLTVTDVLSPITQAFSRVFEIEVRS
jgi:lipoyl(octanoyl) transferase